MTGTGEMPQHGSQFIPMDHASTRGWVRWLVGIIIMYAGSVVFAYLVDHNHGLHYGKDDGLVFLAVTRLISGSIFFFLIKNRILRFPGIGIVTGFLMYLLYILFGGNIVYKSHLVDELTVSTLIVMCGALYVRFVDR